MDITAGLLINIYIYIYFKKKQRNRSHRIINLFLSCYAFLKFPKTRKQINRISSDLFDKKTRIDTSEWEGIEEGWRVTSQLRFNWTKNTLYIYIYTYEDHKKNFQTFFVWTLLLIVYTWNSSPLRSNLLRLQCTCSTVPTTSGRPHGSPLMWACQWPSTQPLPSPQLSHNDSLSA